MDDGMVSEDLDARHTVLTLSGEIDVYTGPAVREKIGELLAAGRHDLVVDLRGVDFMDSTGLGILVAGLNGARDRGGSLSLICTQPSMLKLFEITGLDQVFTISTTVETAVAASS